MVYLKSQAERLFTHMHSEAITSLSSFKQSSLLLNHSPLLNITVFFPWHLCLVLHSLIVVIICKSSLLNPHFIIIIIKTNYIHFHNLNPLPLMLIFHSFFVQVFVGILHAQDIFSKGNDKCPVPPGEGLPETYLAITVNVWLQFKIPPRTLFHLSVIFL